MVWDAVIYSTENNKKIPHARRELAVKKQMINGLSFLLAKSTPHLSSSIPQILRLESRSLVSILPLSRNHICNYAHCGAMFFHANILANCLDSVGFRVSLESDMFGWF